MWIISENYINFNKEKLSFDDFLMTTWEGENESQRKKEPQIPLTLTSEMWDTWIGIEQII